MKYIKFLIIAIFGFCFGLDLEASQQRPKKPTFYSSLAQSEKDLKARVRTEEERREKKSKKRLEKKAKSNEEKDQQAAEVVAKLTKTLAEEEFFDALEAQDQESIDLLKVSQELLQEELEVEEDEFFDAVSTLPEGKEQFVNNQQIVPYVASDRAFIIKTEDSEGKELLTCSCSGCLENQELRAFAVLEQAKDQNSLLVVTNPENKETVITKEENKQVVINQHPSETEAVVTPLDTVPLLVAISQKSGAGRPALPYEALPQSVSGSQQSASKSHNLLSYSNNPSKIGASSFVSRNKVAIVAASALVGGVAYYAATRGLRPETIVKDLKAAKNFCVDNAGKAKEKTIELVGALKEKAPELKSKFNFGLAAIGSYAISGFNNLKWILEDSELE